MLALLKLMIPLSQQYEVPKTACWHTLAQNNIKDAWACKNNKNQSRDL
jgi:hypothetical protein